MWCFFPTHIHLILGERDLTLMKVNMNVSFFFNECVRGELACAYDEGFGVSRGFRSTCWVIVTSTFRETYVNWGKSLMKTDVQC